MQEQLIKIYRIKAYTTLIRVAMTRNTIQSQELIEILGLEGMLDPKDVVVVMNSVYDSLDSFDDRLGSPRLTGLVIKKRTGLPLKKWFDSFLKNNSANYSHLSSEDRRGIWERHVADIYSYWTI